MRKFLLIFALLLGLAAYLNTFSNDFVWDDEALILENRHVQEPAGFPEFFRGSIASGTSRESPYFRPLYMLSFWLDYQLWGAQPWGFHLTNLILHLANIALLFVLVSHFSIRSWMAFFASAFFAVHPAGTEAVTSISGRGWPLCTFFLLAALLIFISYREHSIAEESGSSSESKSAESPKKKNRRGVPFFSTLFFFLALLTMEIAMIFPLLLLLYDGFNTLRLRQGKFLKVLRSHLPFWALLLSFIVFRIVLAGSEWFDTGRDLHLERRILTAPMIFLNYLSILIFPRVLRLERTIPFFRSPAEPAALFSWVAILLLAAVMIYLIRRRRAQLFIFGFLWMTIALIPALNIFPLRAMMAEAWLYVPLVGYSIALGGLVTNFFERFRKTGLCLAGVLIALFLFRTGLRNQDWRDSVTLYDTSVRDSPDSVKMQYNLGVSYSRLERFEDSKREFQKIQDEHDRYMRDFNRNFYSD